mgnify:CR=1 FL=1
MIKKIEKKAQIRLKILNTIIKDTLLIKSMFGEPKMVSFGVGYNTKSGHF